MERARVTERVSLRDIALSFLKLGTIAFGGPAAHVAFMENEFVKRRQWLTQQLFLDRLAAANLLPGPSSTEVAIFIGYEMRGWMGLVVAGVSFILPAAMMVCALAAAYVRYGAIAQVQLILYVLKPVVVAIVLQAIWRLGRTALKRTWLVLVSIIAAALFAYGINEVVVLGIAGLLAAAPLVRMRRAPALVVAPTLVKLFLVFAKTGATLFGSGYVLFAFLRADFVEQLHWLTEKQLLDAIAVGQVTPGPVFTTATFIGYLVAGVPGAIVATIGIFAPAFVLVGASGWIVPRIRRSPLAGSMLDGVVAGSLALMAVAAWQLARTAIVDLPTLGIAVASIAFLIWRRI
jgi:chromate transporter